MIKDIIDNYYFQEGNDVKLNCITRRSDIGGYRAKSAGYFMEWNGQENESKKFVKNKTVLSDGYSAIYIESDLNPSEIAKDIMLIQDIPKGIIDRKNIVLTSDIYFNAKEITCSDECKNVISNFYYWLCDNSFKEINKLPIEEFTFALFNTNQKFEFTYQNTWRNFIVIYDAPYSEEIKKDVISRAAEYCCSSKIYTLDDSNNEQIIFVDEREGIYANRYWSRSKS